MAGSSLVVLIQPRRGRSVSSSEKGASKVGAPGTRVQITHHIIRYETRLTSAASCRNPFSHSTIVAVFPGVSRNA